MPRQLIQKLLQLYRFRTVNNEPSKTVLSVDALEERRLLSSVVQADYRDDFSTTEPDSGWQYLWNAPSDWNGVSSADATDHRFGLTDHYVSLLADGLDYRPSGDIPFDLAQPNRKLRISQTGGRVGAGFQQTGDGNNRISRYAIAAWTVEQDGFHAIRDSWMTTQIGSKGVDIVIHVNDDDPIFRRRIVGKDKTFDTNLGYLQAGDVIYVGFGGGPNDQNGSFRHDFSIVKLEDPGFTILQTDGLTNVSEPGTTDSFSVVLNKKPDTSQRVTLAISTGDAGEVRTNKRLLFFNRSNWNIRQTVSVSGVDDSLDDGTTYTPITVSIDQARTNPEYLSVADQTLIASNYDDESPIAFSSQIASGILRGLNEIVVVPGEYQLTPVNEVAAHSYISWAEDVTIIADQVKVIANELNTGIILRDSRNLTLRGLTIDYQSLPFTQGTVTNIADDRSWIEVSIHDGYDLPSDGDSTRVVAHSPDTLAVKRFAASRHGSTVSYLADRSFRIDSFIAFDSLESGDYVSLTLPINTPHAIWVDRGEHVRLSDITVNASTSFAFFETQGTENEYYDLKVSPGERPDGATIDRLLSSNYDGFHSKNAEVGPKIERSYFSATGDDGIAINGDYTLLARNDGDSIIVASKWRLTRFEAGDQIRVYNETTGLVSEATITDVTLYLGNDIDFASLRDEWLPNLQQSASQFVDGYRLTLSNPLPNTTGDLVSNIDRNGSGYEIRDNVVANTRARSFVLKSPEGIVEGNRLDHIAVTGILISPESQFWMEGDFSTSVQIRNNHLSDIGFFHTNPNRRAGGGISIVADPERSIRGHQNLDIENNLLERIEGPTLTLSNSVGVRIRNNWFREINQTDHGFGQGSAIWIDNSSDIQIENNVIDRPGGYLQSPLTLTSSVSTVDDLNAFIVTNVATTVAGQGVAYAGAVGVNEYQIDESVEALLPGENSSASNISNYDRGLNRIVIDLQDLVRTELTLSDFEFFVGNSTDLRRWQVLDGDHPIGLPLISMVDSPSPDLTRVSLDWDDYSMRNTWLQVTIKANGNTGLSEDHTFYFGNLVGNSHNDTLATGSQAMVDRFDTDQVLANFGAANVTNELSDIDRDGVVDGFDAALTRINYSPYDGGLNMFSAPNADSLEPLERTFLRFSDPPPDHSLVTPESLSSSQKQYIGANLQRWEARLPADLSVAQRNAIIQVWQNEIAERHANRASELETLGRANSALHWSMIALAEREISTEFESNPDVDFMQIAQRWTL